MSEAGFWSGFWYGLALGTVLCGIVLGYYILKLSVRIDALKEKPKTYAADDYISVKSKKT